MNLNYILINSGAFIGSKKSNWVCESEKFLIGYKSTNSIFNTAITNYFFSKALSFVQQTISNGGRGFFFGIYVSDIKNDQKTYHYATDLIKLGQVVSKKNWRGGYVTNTKTFRTNIFNSQKKFSFVVSFKFDYTNFPIINESSRIRLPLVIPIDSNSSVVHKLEYPIPCNASGWGTAMILTKAFSFAVFAGIQQTLRLYSTSGVKSVFKKPNNNKFQKK
jgi:ribosomal protein S2